MSAALVQALTTQANACEVLGSPFNAALLRRTTAVVETGGPVADLLAPWAGADYAALLDAATSLRLVNAFHWLTLGDEDPDLAAAWPQPGRAWDADRAWGEARRAAVQHRALLETFMLHEPQTNEVRRAAALLGGFLTVAAETGLPLRCFEIGASAGLNQFWDRFAYRLGEAAWGDAGSAVQIPCDWRGPPPPLDATVSVAFRAGCDRRPTDLADPAQRRRLLACIWPDQFDRLERAERAIEIARAGGVRIAGADAVAWTRAQVAPQAGAASVLYHSIVWQYLPQESRTALAALIAELGAAATPHAPFAWLRMEPRRDDMKAFELRLTLWPTGEERLLAAVHAHGAWVEWLGG